MNERTRLRMMNPRYRRRAYCRPAPRRADPATNPARAAADAELDAKEAAWRAAHLPPGVEIKKG